MKELEKGETAEKMEGGSRAVGFLGLWGILYIFSLIGLKRILFTNIFQKL